MVTPRDRGRCAYEAHAADGSAVVRCTKRARTVAGMCRAHGATVLRLPPPMTEEQRLLASLLYEVDPYDD